MDPINEDTVQCLLFPCLANANILEDSFLTHKCDKINNTIKTLSQGYIWHRDEFKLNVPMNLDDRDLPYHLASHTCFGDNIEDEWFILYIALEITKIYTDVIMQIRDNDGDFILIEAADYLPQWANPDSTVNRVFLYNGHIHLIPPECVNFNIMLSINDALKIVTLSPERTRVASTVEKAVLDRIGNYPQKIEENVHHAVVNIPAELAALLTLDPNLVAPIVTTYCNHDPLEAKSCRKVSVNDCVRAKVKFTRCLYSMLVHSKLINNFIFKKNDTTEATIGLKLTLGYYMIQKSNKDIFTKAFAKFLRNLKDKGYFKDNIEGSQEYNKLLENAKNYFFNYECSIDIHVYEKIKQLMSTDECIKLKEMFLVNNSNSNLSGDSDDWLRIHPEHLNDLLNERYGKHVKFKSNDIATAQTITDKIRNFFNKSSDFEGVEINDKETCVTDDINFEADKFSECIEKFLNLLVSNDETAVDSDSDYKEEFSDDENCSDDALDEEIKEKLTVGNNFGKSENILQNIVQSMKEENLSPGPSSTLLKTVGVTKNYILDSDDDEE